MKTKFLKITGSQGRTFYINTDHITKIVEYVKNSAAIQTIDGKTVVTKLTSEEVLNLIEKL